MGEEEQILMSPETKEGQRLKTVLLNFLSFSMSWSRIKGDGSEAPLIDPSVKHTDQPDLVLGEESLLPPKALFLP